MEDKEIIALLSFLGAIIAVVTPMMKLNATIVKLNTNFENMMENDRNRDRRIDKHGQEIDEIIEKQRLNEKILDRHELRIDAIEEKIK